jgi:hypothetical protein
MPSKHTASRPDVARRRQIDTAALETRGGAHPTSLGDGRSTPMPSKHAAVPDVQVHTARKFTPRRKFTPGS